MSSTSTSLTNTHRLDNEREEAVTYITDDFTRDKGKAGESTDNERAKLVDKAVSRNLSFMHSVLNDMQFRTYTMLLRLTLQNKGIR